MVRATTAEIKKLFLGGWPVGVSDAKVDDILAGIDYTLDGYVKIHYKTTLSTTDTDVVHIANLIGKQVIMQGLWALAGGNSNRELGPEPVSITPEIHSLIESVLSDVVSDGSAIVPMQGDQST